MSRETVRIVVPKVPPSVNMYIRHTKWGHYKTDEAMTFETYVKLACAHLFGVRAKEYSVFIKVYLAENQKGDVDNFPKSVLDSLARAEMFLNPKGELSTDAHVKRLIVEKHRDKENPRTEVEIEPYYSKIGT